MGIIDRVLQRSELMDQPPVLVDVGASGGINPRWRRIARYATCIAFDPDSREMHAVTVASKIYRRLVVVNRAVGGADNPSSTFFLTRSPACSSSLAPNVDALSEWAFARRFDVERESRIEMVTLASILPTVGVSGADWLKVDSQGTDLRVFRSLGTAACRKTLVVEFEPGLIDCYRNEDKLWQVLAGMETEPFWLMEMSVKGTQRIHRSMTDSWSHLEREYLVHLQQRSPGWAEMAYMNRFADGGWTVRDYMLGWVLATLWEQHGFASRLTTIAQGAVDDPVFASLAAYSRRKMVRRWLRAADYFPLIGRAVSRWRRQLQSLGDTPTSTGTNVADL